jgi:hypothetical protein
MYVKFFIYRLNSEGIRLPGEVGGERGGARKGGGRRGEDASPETCKQPPEATSTSDKDAWETGAQDRGGGGGDRWPL